jgi:hypothetical protein
VMSDLVPSHGAMVARGVFQYPSGGRREHDEVP